MGVPSVGDVTNALLLDGNASARRFFGSYHNDWVSVPGASGLITFSTVYRTAGQRDHGVPNRPTQPPFPSTPSYRELTTYIGRRMDTRRSSRRHGRRRSTRPRGGSGLPHDANGFLFSPFRAIQKSRSSHAGAHTPPDLRPSGSDGEHGRRKRRRERELCVHVVRQLKAIPWGRMFAACNGCECHHARSRVARQHASIKRYVSIRAG